MILAAVLAGLILGCALTGFCWFMSGPSQQRELRERHRRAISVLERSLNDPIYPTTTPFRVAAEELVDDYYKEQ